MFNKNQPKENMFTRDAMIKGIAKATAKDKAKKTKAKKETMETITLKRAIQIINQHGNLDEIYYFFKELGNKKEYKLKDVKSWLGY